MTTRRTRKPQPMRPYKWIVIDAPDTRWMHRLFRWIDIQVSTESQDWPNGIVFQHTKNGQTLVYWQGQLRPTTEYAERVR